MTMQKKPLELCDEKHDPVTVRKAIAKHKSIRPSYGNQVPDTASKEYQDWYKAHQAWLLTMERLEVRLILAENGDRYAAESQERKKSFGRTGVSVD